MKNILVTGANGQLGSEIKENRNRTNNYIFTDISELDITNSASVEKYMQQHHIDIAVNCAAYFYMALWRSWLARRPV